jgi:hypothetical protein
MDSACADNFADMSGRTDFKVMALESYRGRGHDCFECGPSSKLECAIRAHGLKMYRNKSQGAPRTGYEGVSSLILLR